MSETGAEVALHPDMQDIKLGTGDLGMRNVHKVRLAFLKASGFS